jgi:hypothetical protein
MPDNRERNPILTLTSDFGNRDQYVSAMKAVILGISPEVRLIDISHEIPPQDIMAAAWVLKNTAFLYPPGTVHLAVIDPGVGTKRKPIAVKINDQYFVGPDNGLFSLFLAQNNYEAYELNNSDYWFKERSQTFHGRDIFAPVAAHLCNGVELSRLGQKIKKLVTYKWALPIADEEGIQGWVVHIDRYGNLITNISQELLEKLIDNHKVKIFVGNTIIHEIEDTFGSVPEGEPTAIVGSSGMLEIVVNKGNAEQMLGVEKGAPISIMFQK